ncbi:MAG: 6-bladed beta-propeller [Verrucomicrobiales bacterium]|nr:6-bladed beta-propeller [Verrucomicrobiales bacterium]
MQFDPKPATARLARRLALPATACALLVHGATAAPKQPQEFIFYPPPPDEPRIQFLTAFSAESELAKRSRLSEFIVGDQQYQRPIWKPYGITTTPGKLYICDTLPKNLCIVDLAKRRFSYFKPEGQGVFKMPINVAVDAEGYRYITDTVRGQLLIYDKNGKFIEALGKAPDTKPCGVAVAGDRLYVTDMTNQCVRIYNRRTRELLLTLPRDRSNPQSRLFQPTNVALDPDGRIYVSDTTGFAVHLFDAEGNHLRAIGEMGLTPGRFALPKGIAPDRQGRFYVVDAATGVVQLFDREGRLLMYFGETQSGGAGALVLPAGIAVDYDNVKYFQQHVAPNRKIEYLIYVTNQAGPRRVSVYGFLQTP